MLKFISFNNRRFWGAVPQARNSFDSFENRPWAAKSYLFNTAKTAKILHCNNVNGFLDSRYQSYYTE